MLLVCKNLFTFSCLGHCLSASVLVFCLPGCLVWVDASFVFNVVLVLWVGG